MIRVETGNPDIYRFDDVLDQNLCNQIVGYMVNHLGSDKHNDPNVMPWLESDDIHWVHYTDMYLKHMIDVHRFTVTQLVHDCFGEMVYPRFTDTVLWRPGKSMPIHVDDGYTLDGKLENEYLTNRHYSTVTYLNDNYAGGETMFASGFISKPKRGSVVIFRSDARCAHGVTTVEGNRFTLPIWFTTDMQQVE